MTIWTRLIICLAGLYGAAGVSLAAWSAHRAGGELLMTAALFLLLHAGPMLAIALARPLRAQLIAASLLAVGAFLFSGDLSLRLLAGAKPWAMAAPTGGMLLIAGWLMVAATALMRRQATHPNETPG